jgi:DNA processing protein
VDKDLMALLALKRIPGIGNFLLRQLVSYLGSAQAVISSNKASLSAIPGIGSVHAAAILKGRHEALRLAEEECKRSVDAGSRLVHFLQADYPSRLKKIPDAPPVLYLKGNFQFENPRVLAVVGTRQATSYGKEAMDSFFEDLKDFQPVIVSGLAYGIDIHAHRCALNLGLETWAVMGTGLHMVYPSAHKNTAAALLKRGGLITEVPDDEPSEPGRFPERNRIIAGLSDAVWVVEAMEKGGALITARLAVDYFRDVFALPGSIRQASSAGCNQLIASNQAALVSSGKELAQALGWEIPDGNHPKADSADDNILTLSGDEKLIWDILKEGEQHLDDLAWRTSIPVNRLAGILLNLEFAGRVKSMPGKKFARK